MAACNGHEPSAQATAEGVVKPPVTPGSKDQTLAPRKTMWDHFKNEFKWQNFSLSFEKNPEYQRKDPKEVLKYFHSSLVS